jgi:hypothetical protein
MPFRFVILKQARSAPLKNLKCDYRFESRFSIRGILSFQRRGARDTIHCAEVTAGR